MALQELEIRIGHSRVSGQASFVPRRGVDDLHLPSELIPGKNLAKRSRRKAQMAYEVFKIGLDEPLVGQFPGDVRILNWKGFQVLRRDHGKRRRRMGIARRLQSVAIGVVDLLFQVLSVPRGQATWVPELKHV